jgi:hypothetical protein
MELLGFESVGIMAILVFKVGQGWVDRARQSE